MQSQRLPDHADESFGQALHYLIQNQNSSDAKKQIDIIQKNEGLLRSVDEQGRTFLVHALDMKMYDIAKILLTLQKDDDDVIFSVDRDGRTALHAAINHHFITIRLMQIAFGKKRMKDYLVKDNNGNTILHAPLVYQNDLILESVLSVLYLKMKDTSLIEFTDFINAVNKNGKTALHYAFRLKRPKTVRSLIKHGAHLSLSDNMHVSSILFFATLSLEDQLSIFLSLNEDRKKALLSDYRELLIEHNNNELLTNLTNDDFKQFLEDNNLLVNLRENYFKLTIQHSFKTYLLALHEFDDRIPLRKNYERTIVKQNEIIIIPDMPWEAKLLEQMPLYAKKLGIITKAEYDLKNDEDILTNLIDSLDNVVQKLQRGSFFPAANKALAVLIPIIWVVGFVWLTVWLLSEFEVKEKEVRDHQDDKNDPSNGLTETPIFYLASGLIIMTIGIFATAFLLPQMTKLWRREAHVSSDEWEPVIDQLKGILVNGLKDKSELSLAMKDNLNKLEAGVTELETREPGLLANFPMPRKPTLRVATILTRLKDIVEDIRTVVIQGKKSFGLQRLPSSIGLFKPKPRLPYLVLPKEGYLELPTEANSKFSRDDFSRIDGDKDRDNDEERLLCGYKGSLFGSKRLVRYTSDDDDEPLLPVVYRQEFSKQELEAKLLGRDWEDQPQKKSNFRFT